jgi:RNA polymerase sigma-70 factor (ECF subfamily)
MKAEAVESMEAIPTGADDSALLRAFSERGERQAMNVLFARHADAAFRVALRCCRNAADAEDAVQTAFIEVLRHAAKYRGESAVRAWIFGFVVNACRHKAREEGRRAAREEKASVTGELPAQDQALQDAVRKAVRDLPEHYRLPVWLHYCEGLSSPEVADALSLSENTVRSQLSRGVEELRMALSSTGLAVTGVAVVGALATAAVESAPTSLTASISGLAAPVAKAGLVAKLGAATMAAAAILTTAAALWSGGVPDDPRPPEFSKVDEKVREWLPRPEERRFDEIGWAKNLTDALPLAKQSGRGIFVVAHVGHLNTGRTDGGSMSLRGGPLSDPRIIELLNTRFVPVYASTHNKADTELARVSRESLKAGLGSGTEYLYFLDSTGRVIDTQHICTARTPGLLEKLQQHVTGEPGGPLTPPVPQAAAPSAGERALHVTSRYLDSKGQVEKGKADYHAFPAEEWIPLTPADEAALVANPAAPLNATWAVDLTMSAKLLSRVYPLTGNMIDAEKNQLEGAGLTATVVAGRRDIAWIRLDGRVAMDHPFVADRDHRPVDARITGYMEYDRAAKRIRVLRLVTDGARYGRENFAVAIRSVP